jgi:hypothetical protein
MQNGPDELRPREAVPPFEPSDPSDAQTLPEASDLGRNEWLILASAVEKLESAWRTGRPADLRMCLPGSSPQLRLLTLTELVKVDQEWRLRTCSAKPLEEYLREWPELAASKAAVSRLVAAEFQARRLAGESVDTSEYERRFPEIARNINWPAVTEAVERDRRDGAAEQGDRSPELQPGSRLDRFEIRGIVGRGGMGAVYRAYDPRLERDVALKIPAHELTSDSELEQRFLREGRLAASIRHPHICTVYDAGVAEGVHYICMEFIDGCTLAQRLAESPLRPRHAADIVRKVARALDCLHRARLVHRDVAPGNVMLDHNGEPVLTDFGLAFSCERVEVRQEVRCSGTPAYMAPERFGADVFSVDARSDVYSLGVLLYHLLAGMPPFSGSVDEIAASARSARRPVPLALRSGTDRELGLICRMAMAADPNERFPSAAAMAEALGEYLNLPASRFGPWHVAAVAIVTCGALGAAAMLAPPARQDAQRRGRASAAEDAPRPAPRLTPAEAARRREIIAELAETREEIEQGISADPLGAQCRRLRRALVSTLRSLPPDDLAMQAATLLAELPWPKYAASSPELRWWNRMPSDAGSSEPIDPGPDNPEHEAMLLPGGSVLIKGIRREYWRHSSFRVRLQEQHSFHLQIFCLSWRDGHSVLVEDHWSQMSDSHGTRASGYQHVLIEEVLPPDDDWHSFNLQGSRDGEGEVEFLIHIWQDPPTGR